MNQLFTESDMVFLCFLKIVWWNPVVTERVLSFLLRMKLDQKRPLQPLAVCTVGVGLRQRRDQESHGSPRLGLLKLWTSILGYVLGCPPCPGFQSPPGWWYFLVGDRYKASFVTVTGRARGDNPLYIWLYILYILHLLYDWSRKACNIFQRCTVSELRPQSAASVDSVVEGPKHQEGTILQYEVRLIWLLNTDDIMILSEVPPKMRATWKKDEIVGSGWAVSDCWGADVAFLAPLILTSFFFLLLVCCFHCLWHPVDSFRTPFFEVQGLNCDSRSNSGWCFEPIRWELCRTPWKNRGET